MSIHNAGITIKGSIAGNELNLIQGLGVGINNCALIAESRADIHPILAFIESDCILVSEADGWSVIAGRPL